MEQTRAGVKAQRDKVEGWLGNQSNPSGWGMIIHRARRIGTPRGCSKHAGSPAADSILVFIDEALGHKRKVNYKRVGNHC